MKSFAQTPGSGQVQVGYTYDFGLREPQECLDVKLADVTGSHNTDAEATLAAHDQSTPIFVASFHPSQREVRRRIYTSGSPGLQGWWGLHLLMKRAV